MPSSLLPDFPAPTAPAGKPAGPSNLQQRILYGVLGAILLLGSVWFSPWSFGLFFAAVQVIMLWEFYRMMQKAGYRPAAVLGGAISLVLFGCIHFLNGVYHYSHTPRIDGTIYPLGEAGKWFEAVGTVQNVVLGLGLLLPVLLILREMYAWPREDKEFSPFSNIGVALLGLLYVSLPMSLLNVVAFSGDGTYDYRRVFALLFMVWCSDIGAYAAGKTFGRHKLAPKISPGKTWEGAVGGFLLTLAMGWVLGYLLPELSLTYRLVAAGAVALFGPLGDLAESMLKRSVDVKDSGTIMPGHGGLLDRFDAFLFILPVLALLQLLAGK
ncbi:phosphatidate cytidylyltransferase [Hymenobacter sp. BT175]|uniref:phosphatidate cytidylyltransferase n=1 Tax=Hymenobacter translucens TaxID=2886507 RepID=UPI001D0EB39C|nr:phosphatidate cytidylyltransferase [Hymenobacter translucens]MCC2545840.1 phosphatidate cytidylyltransferase [Hymenobacter translucens]